MLIEVYSDLICPWCYLGKRRLERALAERPQFDVETRWLPFELNPTMAVEGADRREYMRARFGDENKFAGAHERLRTLGAAVGIDYQFELATRMPNTRRAHALIAYAGARSAATQNDVVERLFRANFTEGRDIGDPAVLANIAADAGLDAVEARATLDDPDLHAAVAAHEGEAAGYGISGVPTFIFDRRTGFSGAQEVATIVAALDEVSASATA